MQDFLRPDSLTEAGLPAPGSLLDETQAMELALDAARLGVRGANPLVGAVILSQDGALVQVGWHRGAGTRHAEADAIFRAQQAGVSLAGATMFVTLEPCNHTGRTGPCSQAVLDAGIGRLVYAHRDETAQAAGGASYLAGQGVQVDYRPHPLAQQVNDRWFQAAGRRPFVTAKIASSLDGYIAAADGSSQWITGPEARQDGHGLRSRVDAIMVGTSTLLADNPQLTAREADGSPSSSQPLRVVMGQRPLPPETHLGRALAEGKALHLATRDPQQALETLYQQGIRHLLLEGGPTLISAFLTEDLVDEIYWYRAPLLLSAGKPALGDLGISSLAQARRWQTDHLGLAPGLRILGADTAQHLSPAPKI